ncbi:MAG TPA: YceI family protein [Flavobacterium sp.]|nr:YceI family protein [Flavobacterium sp.]
MKKIVLSLILSMLLTFVSCKKDKIEDNTTIENAAGTEDGTKYSVDLSQSTVNWSGSKPTGKHTGVIKFKEGFVNIKDCTIVAGRFFIDMNTITVTDLKPGDGKEDLENHLKGTAEKDKKDHFFNVDKYPTSDLKIVKIEEKEGKTIIYGNLSIKGVTKAVNFPAQVNITDNEVTINSDTLALNRTYFNINYASKSLFADLKDKFIDDEIRIQVNVKATK